MRPIWKRSSINPSLNYVLLLIESNTKEREFELREYSAKNHDVNDGVCIFVTEVIPTEFLISGNLIGISEKVRLSTGEKFGFDSNGRWYTEQEFEEFKAEFRR